MFPFCTLQGKWVWLVSMANCDGGVDIEPPVEATECLDSSIDVQAKMSSDTFYTDAVMYWEVSVTLLSKSMTSL